MEYDQKVKNRMRRVEGQVKGVLQMMEEGRDCREVVMQLRAIKSAIDRTVGVVVSTNLEACVRESIESGEETSDKVQEAIDLLVKSN
ncbi:Copper-sensitive operon repressor [Bhargavaea cecembensis DSE10]|jgi:DNA-binding FrmR family transcriptional regulator|uniref:Copper-sensitive operon repressor n=1 Tax=Bhargavaea cecembensis DSE10 TaxID=1235279 RepID=M7NCD4_9BACL|nr:metal-sensitive transcriptional regulator [Bhargavaea cecembensis]EMR06233.1 Copper-sensitive operon repressor [Bhargavaea cecembensis DSE10]